MDLTVKHEYIDETGIIKFESSENHIKARKKYTPSAAITHDCIDYIFVRCNTIYIRASHGFDNIIIELDYNKFIHMFDDHRLDNKITELSNKLDKVCAHIMTLMIASEALPKDFDGEFP